MANLKLQSAMEYLMTYGWAILIIAVVMVALFSLGILGGNPLGTTCLAQSGFTCQSPILHAATFNVLVGQATGTSWTSANVYWIPAGVSMATYATCPGQASNTITGGISCYNAGSSLSNGGSLTITFVFS